MIVIASEGGAWLDTHLGSGPQLPIGTPNSEQFGFSHDDGSPGTSGGSALTPHVVQIGETSASSVSSQRSLMASVSLPSQRFVCLVLALTSPRCAGSCGISHATREDGALR